jgi:hypothetical protein
MTHLKTRPVGSRPPRTESRIAAAANAANPEVDQQYVPLVEYCHERGLDYYDTWRGIITGRIPARRVGCRWLVPQGEGEPSEKANVTPAAAS